jgi:hypothetical protein
MIYIMYEIYNLIYILISDIIFANRCVTIDNIGHFNNQKY